MEAEIETARMTYRQSLLTLLFTFAVVGCAYVAALQARLPTVCEWASMARQGCLIGYGPDRAKLYQVAARQLAQVFKGMLPEKIPVEQPAVFEFALNARTARTLNLVLPLDLSARADEVIE